MKETAVKENTQFSGRAHELKKIQQILSAPEASLLIVYGRRRVGKTELLEQGFRGHHILKFEGIEGKSVSEQRQNVLRQLAHYAEEPLLAKVAVDSWVEIFELIARYVKKGEWTIYFEEVQWLACYQKDFITELKYVWDNEFKNNPKLRLILCGSSPSFMINHVVKSKALHNRAQHEIPLQGFSLNETKEFLKNKSFREVMDAHLSVGGIPEYLKRLRGASSIFLALCENSFTQGGFFANECEKIFASSLAENPHYKNIIQVLSLSKSLTREQIAKKLKIKPGGGLTTLLADLELCGFVEKIVPFYLGEKSHLARYVLNDPYLQFYYKFIHPIQKDVDRGIYNHDPTKAIHIASLQKWWGFAFERWCRKNHHVLAKILGFSAIRYRAGAFFSRETNQNKPSYQIDLIFDRDDKVFTICEIKYLDVAVGPEVIQEFEKKLTYFPNPKERTVHRVLISAQGVNPALEKRAFFDNVLTLKDLYVS